MDAAQFRQLGHALIDWIAQYRQDLEALPVMSPVQPGAIRARLPIEPPEHGGELRPLELLRDILPGISHWNHPSFFAYFPSNTSYASVLGDLAAAGLGVQGMSWQTSPAATEVEEVMMDWLRQMVGLSTAWSGVVHDTASTATLCALLCARERSSGFSQNRGGLQDQAAPLVVYASEQGHSSIEKAALLAGFGKQFLRLIPTDAEQALLPDRLHEQVQRDRAAGLVPCAMVAAIGTTGTVAFDPLSAMAELAAQHSIWLHVDAAMAGTAMVLPECRDLWQGVEAADSLVFNPHKWMGIGFDYSAYYCRDPEHLIRVMSTNPSYLRTAQDGEVKNFRDWHLQLGRRFRALKFWFHILDQGVEGIRQHLRRDLAHAQWLAEQVRRHPDWVVLEPVRLQTVCIRHRRPGPPLEQDRHNLDLAQRLNASGAGYVTPMELRGQRWIRVSIGAQATQRRHVEAIWRELQQQASVTS